MKQMKVTQLSAHRIRHFQGQWSQEEQTATSKKKFASERTGEQRGGVREIMKANMNEHRVHIQVGC